MSETSRKTEQDFLSCCYMDPAWIDRAIQGGLTERHFGDRYHRRRWQLLCELRLQGFACDSTAVFAEAHRRGILSELGDGFLEQSCTVDTTLGAPSLLAAIIDTYAKRESWKHLTAIVERLRGGTAGVDDVKHAAEQVAEVCSGVRTVHRPIADVADEAIAEAEEAIAGTKPTRTLITTGIPSFDRQAGPMESHEYVVVGARTSHGKSSFMLQVAAHNLHRGKKVAIFTLETSDKAVLKQLVGNAVGVNLRRLADETSEKQREYMAKLRGARQYKNLVIFDRDITMDNIAARCRLLAQSFKPDLVILDYMGIIGGSKGGSAYERMSELSKAMIPLRKALGCTLMVGAQLNRSSEKDNREPTRSDFRDAGGIEEDAHRIIALWRKPGQALDLDHYDYDLLQLKLRDGPLAKVPLRYHAPTTRFMEVMA